MAEDVQDVAALILERLGPMDTWRLQKLVYYSQAWHLAKYGEPLFDAEIQAWAQGPVTPAIYERHRRAFGVFSWHMGQAQRLGTRAREVISWVIEQYRGFSGAELSKISHAEAPWRLTRGGIPADARSDAVIDRRLMRDYYARLLLAPDDAIADAVAGARLEGFELNPEAVADVRRVAAGERSADDAVADIIARHRNRH